MKNIDTSKDKIHKSALKAIIFFLVLSVITTISALLCAYITISMIFTFNPYAILFLLFTIISGFLAVCWIAAIIFIVGAIDYGKTY